MPEHSMRITRCPWAAAPVPGCRLAAGTTVARARAARATVPPLRYPPGGRPSPRAALSWPGGHPGRSNPWLGSVCQARPRAGPRRLDVPSGVEGGCQRSRVEGQPAPSAGQRPGRCQQARLGRAVGHCPGRRARHCRPSPPAGPGRPVALASPYGFHTWRLAAWPPGI